MRLGRHRWLFWTVPALIASLTRPLFATEGIETGGEFLRHPIKELTDAPGPASLTKDSIVLAVARHDEDYLRYTFGLRRFALDGKEDTQFGDAANTPFYFPRGGRRVGNAFHDLAGKIDPAAARSTRNFAQRVLPTGDSGWLVGGRVGGDEGKILPALLKVRSDGTVDGNFGKAGRAVLPPRHRTLGITAMARAGEKSSDVLLGLPATKGMAIGRIDGKGELDRRFGDDGITHLELDGYDAIWPQHILAGTDGSAVVLTCATFGTSHHVVLARLDASGVLDADKFGNDRRKSGWTRLKQTTCAPWTTSPRSPDGDSAYVFAAELAAARSDDGGILVGVDGADPGDDGADPIFGAQSLRWQRGVLGVVRLTAEGVADGAFGAGGVVALAPPRDTKATFAGLAVGEQGVLWIAAVLREEKGSSLAWARLDAKGAPLAWAEGRGRNVARVEGDWLVFPQNDDHDLSVSAVRLDGKKATAFGFAAPRRLSGKALEWRLWQVSE
jgi:hypothetical protein